MQDGVTLRTRHKIILLDYAPFRLLVNLIRGAGVAPFLLCRTATRYLIQFGA
jgi:hypothetical protein